MKKNTITSLVARKGAEPVTCITAYDYTSAKILDDAGIDILLIGDSLAMVMQGVENTLPVTIDEIIYHTKMVKRGVKRAFVIADMPFGGVNTADEGVANCVRIIKETGADAVKIEGCSEIVQEIIRRCADIGINVVAHIGLMPQYVGSMGGYKIQGFENCPDLLREAKALSKAGARMIVLEGIETACSKIITNETNMLTIGIGAGVHCDGQVLVYHDVFGFYTDMKPKFVKRYAEGAAYIKEAALKFAEDVKNRAFPDDEHSYIKE